MNVYSRAVMSEAKRQANSNVVQMALKPALNAVMEAKSEGAQRAPQLLLP
jgi:hypothetical protein